MDPLMFWALLILDAVVLFAWLVATWVYERSA